MSSKLLLLALCVMNIVFLDPSRFIASTALTLLLIILPTSFNKVNIYICMQAKGVKKVKFNVLLIRVQIKSKDSLLFLDEVYRRSFPLLKCESSEVSDNI